MNLQGHDTPTTPHKPAHPTHHKPTAHKPGHHKPVHHNPTAHKPTAHKPAHHKPHHKHPDHKKSAPVWELDLTETPDALPGLKQGGHIH